MPESTIPSLAVRTSMCSPREDLLQTLLESAMSGVTCTSTLAISLPSGDSSVSVVRPGALPRT